MQVKVKKEDSDGVFRLESKAGIKEILVNEDMMNPTKETVSICFRGKNTSGIVELTTDEIEHVYRQVKSRVHLVKGFKVFKAEKGSLI